MKRVILALSFAVTSAALVAAQDVKSQTTVKADDAKPVMFTGCLQTGTTAATYILENAVPVKQETKTETQVNAAGQPQTSTTTTSTTYQLVPQGSVEFQQNVGHKVEVTAMMIPAGDDTAEIKTQTKTEVEGAPDKKVETKEKVEQGAAPQLRVVSVKHLADRCLP